MTDIIPIEARAVTLDNFEDEAPAIAAAIGAASLIGLDIETAQPRAHAGIQRRSKRSVVFDTRRTDLCGISLWPEGSPVCWYFNVGHADVEARIPWPMIEKLLAAKHETAKWVVHNAVFERTMLASTVGYELRDYVCTLLLAVSAYGPDEYDRDVLAFGDLGGIADLAPDIRRVCYKQDVNDEETQKLLSKVTAKESDGPQSWNALVDFITYGYSLKKAVHSWFGHQMTTYKQVLGEHEHMGQLRTKDVVAYGCDDAVWCVRLFHKLIGFMAATNPAVVPTFFHQELPMVEVYSKVWRTGIRINVEAVRTKQRALRLQFAEAARTLKQTVRGLLPFPAEPNAGLMEHEEWYRKNHARYRTALAEWARSPDSDDPFVEAARLSGAIPSAWAIERGEATTKALNLTHYMVARTLFYDLFGQKLILMDGKVQSDSDTRGRLAERITRSNDHRLLPAVAALSKLATIEQAEKLYITPYLDLHDPETGRLYPVISSMLATRRMATENPNPMQLAKRGESVYVRGFFGPDHPDHVIVSLDWSQLELVLLADASGDAELHRCYSVIPYDDVHFTAAHGALGVDKASFQRLKEKNSDVPELLLRTPGGVALTLDNAYKFWRTEVGKGANFEWAYSGYLANVGRSLGWTPEETMAATQRYEEQFAGAAQWRRDAIRDASECGYIELPDHHRRVRFEATPAWAAIMRAKFARFNHPAISWFGEQVIRRIQRRAQNQIINARIQGTNATLAKRSIVRINAAIGSLGWTDREARFMFPVHDELVYSVHRDRVCEFIPLAQTVMTTHPDIVPSLPLDCTPSVGLTFQPWHKKDAPFGQIELYEAPEVEWLPKEFHGKRLPPEYWTRVVDFLFQQRDGDGSFAPANYTQAA